MKIIIPENLSEATVGQYKKFAKIVEENPDNEEFLAMKMIEVFCNISMKEVQQIPVNDVEDIVATLNKTFESKRKFKQRVMFNGKEYGFIPDLENISMGEYVDMSAYIEGTENLDKLMAVLYRPIKYKSKELYSIEKYDPKPEKDMLMNDFPLDVALEGQGFFLTLSEDLLRNLTDCLPKEQHKETKRHLGRNGGGIKAFTQSLRATFSSLTR